ncbi:MAG: hypothetical protein U9N77_14645 [Thermodesulfobacteriota bacterium]|nr:hypothetical protein [Thermodesulfobacteriota bacterium]
MVKSESDVKGKVEEKSIKRSLFQRLFVRLLTWLSKGNEKAAKTGALCST